MAVYKRTALRFDNFKNAFRRKKMKTKKKKSKMKSCFEVIQEYIGI